jgi:hypothetical protein
MNKLGTYMDFQRTGVSVALALVSAGFLSSASSALASEKSFDLDNFTGVAAAQGLDVEVVVGKQFLVTASSDSADQLDNLKFRVKDEVLILGREYRSGSFWDWWKSSDDVSVTVEMPNVDVLKASSGAELLVEGVNCERLSIDASSGSDIEVIGRCNTASIDASSGAGVDLRRLELKTATADASSGADINLNVSDAFYGDASSGADIDVYGQPAVAESDTSSGADIDFRGAE